MSSKEQKKLSDKLVQLRERASNMFDALLEDAKQKIPNFEDSRETKLKVYQKIMAILRSETEQIEKLAQKLEKGQKLARDLAEKNDELERHSPSPETAKQFKTEAELVRAMEDLKEGCRKHMVDCVLTKVQIKMDAANTGTPWRFLKDAEESEKTLLPWESLEEDEVEEVEEE
ncbi:MAG: hypothetical protein Q9200_007813 [Gallowayella weberi]